MQIKPEEHPFLLTEPPINPKTNREKMAKIMFENFNAPAMYIGLQPALSMYSNGLLTGLVLDSGEGASHAIPISNGYIVSDGVMRLDLAGHSLTGYLARKLSEGGCSSKSISDMEIVRGIKEKVCYVAKDFEKETASAASSPVKSTYELPDGQVITLGNERFTCPEAMFRPCLLDVSSEGVHKDVFQSITKCNTDLRKELYANIILSGGNTLIQGFQERLLKEIIAIAPSKAKVEVKARPERQYSVWIGGSILASLPDFEKIRITKKEYDEVGPSIVHQKK